MFIIDHWCARAADMFHGMVVTEVALPGLDHVISITCSGDKVFMRTYSIHFKRSGTKVGDILLCSSSRVLRSRFAVLLVGATRGARGMWTKRKFRTFEIKTLIFWRSKYLT